MANFGAFRNLSLLLLLSATWGSSFTFIKVGVEEIPPFVFTALRLQIAAGVFLVCLAVVRVLRPGRLLPGRFLPFFWVGLGGNVLPFCLISFGEQTAASAEAAIVIGLMPCFALLLAGLFKEERITPRRFLGVLLGFGGVFILFEGGDNPLADGMFVLAAFSYAATAVYGRRLARKYGVLEIMAFSTIFAALIMLPWSFAFPQVLASASNQAVLAAGLLGLLHTVLAGLLFFYLLQTCGINFTVFCNYAIPLFGAFWGWLFLGETLETVHLLALGTILAGLVAIHRRSPAGQNVPQDHGETHRPKNKGPKS